MSQDQIQVFVHGYLREIAAEVQEADGVFTVTFPPGRKRRFGGQRRFVFDPAKAAQQIEVLEPGSPLLKLLLIDAKQWGGLGVAASDQVPPGTFVYTFQFNAFSSLRKRTKFLTAVLKPEATQPDLTDGVPQLLQEGGAESAQTRDVERVQNALIMALPSVEAAARLFADDTVRESAAEFQKAMGRVNEYFQGMRHQTFTEEARIKKRLGEIQSKLYFAEDGLRQLKLEKERDRLTQELYVLKQRRTQAEDKLSADQTDHVERQRRRHEPKLQVRLVAATLIRPPAKDPEPTPEPEPAPAQPSTAPAAREGLPHGHP